MIYSFDIFDTCLVRKIAFPSDLFYILGSKLLSSSHYQLDQYELEKFVAARINAEIRARQNSKNEDITLKEIWQELCHEIGWEFNEKYVSIELETESDYLSPILSTREQIQNLRTSGHPIIFISDIYLPESFVKVQLIKHGFAKNDDEIYISGEIGKSKYTGNLYLHVLRCKNISPNNLIHTGDNRHSDYEVPRKLGIKCKFTHCANFTEAETTVLKSSSGTIETSLISGAMRASRLANSDRGSSQIISQFLGPFILGFACWVLQRAKSDGIKRLYFLSRDCQLVWHAAKELSKHYGNIECHYLFVSRQSLYLPSVSDISPGGMPWLRRNFEVSRLKNLLAKLELIYEDFSEVFKPLSKHEGEQYILKCEEDWRLFWKILTNSPIKEILEKKVSDKQIAAKQYFTEAGLLKDDSWAIVDLGWYLTGQQSLAKLLKKWNYSSRVKGYYLALKKERICSPDIGVVKALFYESSTQRDSIVTSSLYSHQTFLEHIVGLADHPPVRGYQINTDHNAKVIFSQSEMLTYDLTLKIQKSLISFLKHNLQLVDVFQHEHILRISLNQLANAFFRNPSHDVVSEIRNIPVASDQNNMDSTPLAEAFNLKDAIRLCLPNKIRSYTGLSNNFHNQAWHEASLTLSSFPVRLLLNIRRNLSKFIRKWCN